MCPICDGQSTEDYLWETVHRIERHGWAIQTVHEGRRHPPWAYTVGLTLLGLAELVVTGMRAEQAARFLNERAGHQRHARTPHAHGDRVELIGGPTVEYVELPHPDAHLYVATTLLGNVTDVDADGVPVRRRRPVRGLQVVWSDDRGRRPWDPGFRGRRGGQPVLGPRARS